MKKMTRIFAVVLAVMMVALMIPFSAGAAVTTKTLTLSCDKTEFTFDVYQLATIDTATGEVSVKATDATVVEKLSVSGSESATVDLINACDAATSGLGTKVATYDASDASKNITVDTGIYYIKPIAKGIATKANSSIAVVTKDLAVNLASKVATDGIDVTKEISAVRGTATATAKEKAVATASLGDVIEYTLTAKVPNSGANPLSKYVIKDTIESGLTVDMSSITVKMGDTSLVKDTDYTVDGTNSFNVALAKNDGKILEKFYGKTITVVFNAKVNENATSGTNSNDNEDSVEYQFANKANPESDVEGEKVQVFTFLINLTKVDSVDNNTKLSGAEFKLTAGNETHTATSDANGIVDFGVQLAEGTYTVVETKAPDGYVLNPTEITVTINPTIKGSKGAYALTNLANGTASTGVIGKTVTNVKVAVPSTGGMGTTMFTVVGAILIAAAGVMFVILKKKSSAK